MEFRVKDINLVTGDKWEQDFPLVLDALICIQERGWRLNEKLYELMNFGFIQDAHGMVMLLGVYDGGTEDMINHPLIAGQMGAAIFPMPIPDFLKGVVKDDNA